MKQEEFERLIKDMKLEFEELKSRFDKLTNEYTSKKSAFFVITEPSGSVYRFDARFLERYEYIFRIIYNASYEKILPKLEFTWGEFYLFLRVCMETTNRPKFPTNSIQNGMPPFVTQENLKKICMDFYRELTTDS